jgi:hypothetical protein
MELISLVWKNSPRWLRGWFIGNAVYILLMAIGMKSEYVNILAMGPMFFAHQKVPAYPISEHLAWGGIFAVLVAWKGEFVGSLIAVLVMPLLGLLTFVAAIWGMTVIFM